jgi:hypothetical protein
LYCTVLYCTFDKRLLFCGTKLALFGWAVVITAVLLLLSLPVLAGRILPALNLAICWEELWIFIITLSAGNSTGLNPLGILRDYMPKLSGYKNQKYMHTHNNYKINKNFASYLAGLIEGDGSIIVPKTERSPKGRLNYPAIKIAFDLRDFPLAQMIQKTLGHGSLSRMKGINAYLLTINNYEGVLLLIHLLNGNMRTHKIEYLYSLIDFYNKKYDLNILKAPLDESPLDSNSWLSGFIEADGSFSLFINKKSIRLRFSLTQTKVTENNISNEKVMNSLAKFLNVKMYAVENKKSKNLELTVKTQSIINNKILIEYLKLYPLWSGKYLNFKDWEKALEIFISVSGMKNKPEKIYKDLFEIKNGMNNNRTIYNWDHLLDFYSLKE